MTRARLDYLSAARISVENDVERWKSKTSEYPLEMVATTPISVYTPARSFGHPHPDLQITVPLHLETCTRCQSQMHAEPLPDCSSFRHILVQSSHELTPRAVICFCASRHRHVSSADLSRDLPDARYWDQQMQSRCIWTVLSL